MRVKRTRRLNRLEGYDYSRFGVYFVTVCVRDKHEVFGAVVGAVGNRPLKANNSPRYVQLTDIGKVVEIALSKISEKVEVNKYVIMPNHIHIIFVIRDDSERNDNDGQRDNDRRGSNDGQCGNNGRLEIAPTISSVVRFFKSYVTKQIGYSIWQKSFHDRIIRSEDEYRKISQYIDDNPSKWEEDCYYIKNRRGGC